MAACVYDDFVYFYDMISSVSFIQGNKRERERERERDRGIAGFVWVFFVVSRENC